MRILREWWELLAADPVTLAAAMMVTAAVLGLVLVVTSARAPKEQTAPNAKPAQARSLAATGASITEIARRTGLSHDAVALVMTGAIGISDERRKRKDEAPANRKGRPASARIAVMPTVTEVPTATHQLR